MQKTTQTQLAAQSKMIYKQQCALHLGRKFGHLDSLANNSDGAEYEITYVT